MVQSTSKEDLHKSAEILLSLADELPDNAISKDIDFLKDYILEDISGHWLVVLRCLTCGAHIITDKATEYGKCRCPTDYSPLSPSHRVIVEKHTLAILKTALNKPTPRRIDITPITVTGKSGPEKNQ